MESGDDRGLRSRCQAIPKIPTFPDLDNSLDEECNQEQHQQGNGGNHVSSNGKNISTPSSAGPRQRTLNSFYSERFDAMCMLIQPLPSPFLFQ